MALNFDIRKDLRYQQGLENGVKTKQDKMILSLLKKGKLSPEEIAEVAEVTLEYVNNLAKTLKK